MTETGRLERVRVVDTVDFVEVLQIVTNCITVGMPVDTVKGSQTIRMTSFFHAPGVIQITLVGDEAAIREWYSKV